MVSKVSSKITMVLILVVVLDAKIGIGPEIMTVISDFISETIFKIAVKKFSHALSSKSKIALEKFNSRYLGFFSFKRSCKVTLLSGF